MLNRRLPSLTSSSTSRFVVYSPTTIVSLFHSRRFSSNNNNNKSNEDADELAREQRLREMFNKNNNSSGSKISMWEQMKQVHAQAKQFAEQQTAAQMAQRASAAAAASTASSSTTTQPQQQTSSSTSSSSYNNTSTSSTPSGQPPVPSWFGPSQTFWTTMIYITALYSTFLVWQLSDEQSFVSLTQGVPHWANSGYDAAAYMLFRIIYSYRDQRRIQSEFEAMAPMAGTASFLDFLAQRYSMNLSGATISFPEVVALIAGAMRQDFPRYTTVIAQAANSARGESREKIDAIANALRTQGVQPMYYSTTNTSSAAAAAAIATSSSNLLLQQQQRQQQQQQFLGVPTHTYSPYSAPIPPQLAQQAQGMHVAGMSSYGNPQLLQQFRNQVYNPYYAPQQPQQQQSQKISSTDETATSSTTEKIAEKQ